MKAVSITLFLIALFASSQTHAQLKGFSVGPYIESAWPKGKFNAQNTQCFGAGLAADIKLPAKLGLMGSVGYMFFGHRRNEAGDQINAVPFRLGIKYRLPLIYFKLETGVVKYNQSEQSNATVFSPGVGLRVLGLDIQASYESWIGSPSRSFGLVKLGYHF